MPKKKVKIFPIFMKKKYHILITIIISVTVFVFCPLIYLTPAFDYNLFIEKNINAEFKEQIKKDNLILNKKENEEKEKPEI